jgi:hypothetical protein
MFEHEHPQGINKIGVAAHPQSHNQLKSNQTQTSPPQTYNPSSAMTERINVVGHFVCGIKESINREQRCIFVDKHDVDYPFICPGSNHPAFVIKTSAFHARLEIR